VISIGEARRSSDRDGRVRPGHDTESEVVLDPGSPPAAEAGM